MFWNLRSRSESPSPAPAPDALPGAAPGEAHPVPPAGVSEAASFEEIVERYHGKVFQLTFRYTGDYEAACDLTQDTFVRAYGAWGEFRGDSQIFTWLYRIAINLCHNHQKKTKRRSSTERFWIDAPHEDGEGGEGFQVADERPLPAQLMESDEIRSRLRHVLAELPENYRTVVVLRDIEGLSYEEIARVTGSSLEAIKSRLFRARNTIRRLMEPYMNEPLGPSSSLSDSLFAATPEPNKVGNRPRMKRS